MKTQAASTLISSLFALSSMTSTGAVLISTGFAGTTLGGGDAADMTDVTYTVSDGLTGPETIGSNSHSIFNTGDSTGHYAPNVQVNNGSWSLSFDMAVGGTGLNIDSVTLDRRHFNVAGAFNTASDKTYPITVQLVGSTTGVLDTVILDPSSWSPAGTSAVTETFSFGGATVGAGETLTMNLTVGDGDPANNGIFVGFDGFAVIGSAIPEPSAALLAGLGGLLLLRRHRK